MENKFETIPVLDKGFVRLVDSYGDDSTPAMAARVSYGGGTKSVRDDTQLVDYLIRHHHDSPIEMVDFTFHIKLPLFVFAQLVRHRTTSLNSLSARYSEMKEEFYIPASLRTQSKTNKQGSIEDESLDSYIIDIEDASHESYQVYQKLLKAGVARELARMVLPQNLYTEIYWKQNLRNLLHLLSLRMDSHAQYEIQCYANAMYEIVKLVVPNTLASWENHVKNSVTFSAQEVELLIGLMIPDASDRMARELAARNFSKGYAREIKEKLGRLLNG